MLPAWIPSWVISRLLPGLLIAALLGWVYSTIDGNGYDRAEAKYKPQIQQVRDGYEARLAADKIAHDKALLAAEKLSKDLLNAEAKKADMLAVSLHAANTRIDAQQKQLDERKNEISTLYRSKPTEALQSIPAWIVTNGWVCDYNRAIGYGMSDTGTSAAFSGNALAACTADPFSPSGVSAVRIIGHHENYGAYCQKLEQQVDHLLDYIEFVELNRVR